MPMDKKTALVDVDPIQNGLMNYSSEARSCNKRRDVREKGGMIN
jgi:hypothetical protein